MDPVFDNDPAASQPTEREEQSERWWLWYHRFHVATVTGRVAARMAWEMVSCPKFPDR